jgi:malonate-semialdehyde dehydrogenase (acetylating)/methylmalonate-semialdehyde dehydrogenase
VFNVVHGDKVAVDRLLEHPDVAAVSFVGSTPIAKYIYETGTRNGKRVQALGGAKNHMIVLPDADMELAADAAVGAGYGSAGRALHGDLVLVTVGDAADKLIPLMKERIAASSRSARARPGRRDGPAHHPRQHRDKVAGYVDEGRRARARAARRRPHLKVAGATRTASSSARRLFDNVTPSMAIYQDEIFGPVLGVLRVATPTTRRSR